MKSQYQIIKVSFKRSFNGQVETGIYRLFIIFDITEALCVDKKMIN